MDAGEARHNGVHRFFIGKGATVTYDESMSAPAPAKVLGALTPLPRRS